VVRKVVVAAMLGALIFGIATFVNGEPEENLAEPPTEQTVVESNGGTATDGFQIVLRPDPRVPSAFLLGTHTFELDFATVSLQWETGLWSYVGYPPSGYGMTFYVFNLTPALSFPVGNGWECQIGSLLQYRTNLPDRIVFAPEITFWHSW